MLQNKCEKAKYDESAATPEQMYEYLLNKFAIDTETYDRYRAYQIVVIRYALYLSSYQKYIAIGIAGNHIPNQRFFRYNQEYGKNIPDNHTTVVMWLVKQGLNR